jgi:hypothetical protein
LGIVWLLNRWFDTTRLSGGPARIPRITSWRSVTEGVGIRILRRRSGRGDPRFDRDGYIFEMITRVLVEDEVRFPLREVEDHLREVRVGPCEPGSREVGWVSDID